jgi:hypothetical protein
VSARWLLALVVASLLGSAAARAQETETETATEPETATATATEPETASETTAEVPPPPSGSITPRAAPQASDDERPPVSRPLSATARRRAERYAAGTARAEDGGPPPVDGLASPRPPPPDPYAGRRYPVRAASRPLTLAEGTARLDHALLLRGSDDGLHLIGANQLAVGLTNDVEIGLSWPITRDPTLIGTFRVFGSDVVDVGARVAVMIPVITTGDTVLRMSIPIVLRGWDWLRVQTGVDVDLLLTAQVSPLVEIPLQVMAQVSPRFFLGVQGAAGWLDGTFWTGQVGAFVGHTLAATDGHPIFETRASGTYLIDEQDFVVSVGVSFFPRIF